MANETTRRVDHAHYGFVQGRRHATSLLASAARVARDSGDPSPTSNLSVALQILIGEARANIDNANHLAGGVCAGVAFFLRGLEPAQRDHAFAAMITHVRDLIADLDGREGG
jgi:hypothetical protein